METTDKKYFDHLDALRCLAFLGVFYAHTGTIFTGSNIVNAFPMNVWERFTEYGSYGVNFFFVLSGFLITYLLIREKTAHGGISIRKFYIRRILRIWPVYFATLLFATFVLPFLISSGTYKVFTMTNPHMSWHAFLYFFFFAGNFYQGLGFGFASLSIGILWSVCVEEQFYLVWPWIVRRCTLRKLTLITMLLICLSLLYKFLWADDRVGNYYLPWSVGMDLAFGALFGIFYFVKKQRQVIAYSLGILGASLLIIAGVLALTYTGLSGLAHHAQLSIIRSSLVEILRLVKTPMLDCVFVLILLFFVQETRHLSAAKHPVIAFFHLSGRKAEKTLMYLGKISYGLYAYHTMCLMLTVQILYGSGFLTGTVNGTDFFAIVLGALALTVLVAHLSSVYIERHILAFKDRIK